MLWMKTAIVRLIIGHLGWRLEQTVCWCLSSNTLGMDSHRRRLSPFSLFSRLHPSGNGRWLYVTTFAQSVFHWVKCRQVDLHRLQAEASEWLHRQPSRGKINTGQNHLVVPWWDGSQVKMWSEGPRWEGSGHFLRAISYRPRRDTGSPCTQRLYLFISWE